MPYYLVLTMDDNDTKTTLDSDTRILQKKTIGGKEVGTLFSWAF